MLPTFLDMREYDYFILSPWGGKAIHT